MTPALQTLSFEQLEVYQRIRRRSPHKSRQFAYELATQLGVGVAPQPLTNPNHYCRRPSNSGESLQDLAFTLQTFTARELYAAAQKRNTGKSYKAVKSFIYYLQREGRVTKVTNKRPIVYRLHGGFKISLEEKAQEALKSISEPWSILEFAEAIGPPFPHASHVRAIHRGWVDSGLITQAGKRDRAFLYRRI
jgi:hypothetical protein